MLQRLLLGGCLVAAVGCATVPIPPDAKEIDTFDIEGEKQLSESDIKEKIVTTVSPWLPTWLPGVEPQWFDPITWQADLRRIQRFYEANGYYQARVLEDVVTEPKPKHIKLLVRLREGDAARIETLAIVGLEELPGEQQKTATGDLPLQLGEAQVDARAAPA